MILKLAKKINKSKNFVRKKTSKSSWQPTLKKKITDTNHKHHKKICIRNIIERVSETGKTKRTLATVY
jgi:hypothetical protein